ncbi:hypothetical protein [Catellatospora sp. NPDC049609]|uniref:hypothetical protein n=1 Tax=Catellatospora sp. NPDC049609 TaxID=3155505 RepID=UPI003421D7A2
MKAAADEFVVEAVRVRLGYAADGLVGITLEDHRRSTAPGPAEQSGPVAATMSAG